MGAAPPKAATDYDVVVIGSRVSGYTAANRAGQLGLKTACVEGAAVLGGTCLNVGCIPSKALLHASELFDLARTKFAGFGIKVSPELHLPTMMVQKQASVDALGHGIEFLFHKNQGRSDRSLGPACRAGQCSRAQTMLAIEYFQKGNLAMTLARLKSVAGIPIPDTTLCSRDRLAGIELT